VLIVRRALAAAVVASQLAGCFTYAINVDEPSGETIGIFAGVDVAAGIGLAAALTVSDGKLAKLPENLLIGVGAAFLVDLAIGLGVTTADFVGGAHDESAVRDAPPRGLDGWRRAWDTRDR
jgi:hypothetical protein